MTTTSQTPARTDAPAKENSVQAVTADLIRRYDRPGPRYTSYPTAVEFHEGVDGTVYAEHLRRAAERADDPLSLYVHLPFCEERCLYCGCNVVITRKRQVLQPYLDALHREIRRVAARLGDRRRVRQLHWGGGTPTYLTAEEMRDLHAVIASDFSFEEDAETAIEVDPRVTTREHLETLRDLGFRRLSLGVQDFTLEVQEAVNRIQSYEDTADLVATARELGFESLNLDLIYGLPHQNPETFRRTLEQVVEIRPERIAVYSYAHVPWLKVQQRRIMEETLPSPETKLELVASAFRTFSEAGYLSIGMDHFALPEDDLGRAVTNGTLWRNFMGYTVRHAPDMVATGMSAISDVDGAYFQNQKKLIRYQNGLDDGALPVERGVVLSDDDRIRRHVITALMCQLRLAKADVEKRFGIDFDDYFAGELQRLETFADDGFLNLGDDALEVRGTGRLFVRNLCMVFDPYLQQPAPDDTPRFSRTV